MSAPNQLTYADAGVSIDAGEEVVRRIKPLVRKTFNANVLTDIGGFGGLYDARFPGMSHPILVSSTDGVGTKIKVAIAARRYDTVGQDLVNHCTNDILVCGARPIFFLDYFATGKLDVEKGTAIIGGFAKACEENGCALIGGETAEMPGMYANEDFDLAGTIVGIVEREHLLSRDHVRAGDVLIGLPSTGLHTNGFSLARKVLIESLGVNATPPELGGESVADVLLKVHRSYLHPIMNLFETYKPNVDIHGLSHITGGGIVGNTSRVLSDDLEIDIDWSAWNRPVIYSMIQSLGNVPEDDMRRTFNLGIGLIIIAGKDHADGIVSHLRSIGEEPIVLGVLRKK